MHTVVLGWFGVSAVWFLPLLWRLARSVLPGGAGLRGPGTIRLWLGFAGVLVASCALEATLIDIAGMNGLGRLIAAGLSKLAGHVAPPLAMTVLLAAALPWLLDFRWRDVLMWADLSLGLGLGIRPRRDGDAPREARRSRRAQAADATPPQRGLSTTGAPPLQGERRTRPTVWRPPATTRRIGAGSTAAAATGAAASAGQTPRATPSAPATWRTEPGFGARRATVSPESGGATTRPLRSAELGASAPARSRTSMPAGSVPMPSRPPETISPAATPLRTTAPAAATGATRAEPVAPAGWLRSGHTKSLTDGANGPDARDGSAARRPPAGGGAEPWRVDAVRSVAPSPNVARPPLHASSSAVAAAAVAAQHGFTTPPPGQLQPFGGASRARSGPPPVAGSTAARAAATAPANRQARAPRPFVWSPRHPPVPADAQQAFDSRILSGGVSPAYPAPTPADSDAAREPVSGDIAATLRTIEENTARWTAIAGANVARRGEPEGAERAPGAADGPIPANAATHVPPTATVGDVDDIRRPEVAGRPIVIANASAEQASPAEPAAPSSDPLAGTPRADDNASVPGFDRPVAIAAAQPSTVSGLEGKPIGAPEAAASEASRGAHSSTLDPDAITALPDLPPQFVVPASATEAAVTSAPSQPDDTSAETRQSAIAADLANAGPTRPTIPAATHVPAATVTWLASDAESAIGFWESSADAAAPAGAAAAVPTEGAASTPVAAPGAAAVPPVSAALPAAADTRAIVVSSPQPPVAAAPEQTPTPAAASAPIPASATSPASTPASFPAFTPVPAPTPAASVQTPLSAPALAPTLTSAPTSAAPQATAAPAPAFPSTAATAAPAPAPASVPSAAVPPQPVPGLPPVAAEPAPIAPAPDTAPPPIDPSQRPALRGHAPTSFEFRPPAASAVELPGLDLLERASSEIEPVSEEKLAQTGQLIEQRLQEFKVPVVVVGASAGPVITRFEIEPALGVRGSQIVGLMKDLSRGLGLTSIRVVETIPGKTCMGLELPNARRQMIRLSEILESGQYQRSASKLTIAMGKDIVGHPVVTDLAKAPHMLVAGTTGSGKSVAINAMILSLLYKATPEEVRLIMIDPKMLELSVYEGIPHLLAPVVTDMKLAANALNWCVGEMEKRYRLMSAVGVRNLAGFNQKIRDAEAHERKIGNPFSLTPDDPEPLARLPMIVVVIDELADLMMVAGKKIEELIARLAQKARAAGIHLILATQRPSVDVITGLIKANIPTRVAFQVSSKIDSRTILDQMGAESLLGQGDMLFLPPGTGYPQRVHGAFVADEEVHSVVEYLKQFGEPEYIEGILDGPATEGAPQDLFGDTPDAEADPLYDEAVAFVLRTRRASISSVQRQLRIGYNRAARLVEQMEAAGLVSTMGINGSREVLAPGPAE